MAHIKFDYSKLTPFVAENELDEINGKSTGQLNCSTKEKVLGAIISDGLTFLKITTKKNLLVFKKQLKNSI